MRDTEGLRTQYKNPRLTIMEAGAIDCMQQLDLSQILVVRIVMRIGVEWDGRRTAVRVGHLRTGIYSACAHSSTRQFHDLDMRRFICAGGRCSSLRLLC